MIRAAYSIFCMLAWLVLSAPAAAVLPDEVLADPALEARARAISRELRCLVCQNQSIDDSDADLARDLRLVVRERLMAGDDDAAVIDYVAARYGDFVLLRPPFKPATWALWLGPPMVAAGAAFAVFRRIRRRRPGATAPPLTEAERRRVVEALSRLDDDAP